MPLFDVAGLLSYVAPATSTIRLGSWIYVLPARNPVVAARAFQSVDVHSGGRAEMGVGVVYVPEEFPAAASTSRREAAAPMRRSRYVEACGAILTRRSTGSSSTSTTSRCSRNRAR
jgi:alkanesulfonate monooxygenase SsuD/methylene tetrahydromethanopterin reductase-like flavin-dependent oxidoreductase (luciferase family)